MIENRKIIVGFSSHKKMSWFSKLIAFVISAKYSHAYIRFIEENNESMVYQASGSLINSILYHKFIIENTVYAEKALYVESYLEAKTRAYCEEMLGTPYSSRNMIGLLFVRIFRLKKNPFSDGNNGMTCGEFVARALENVGFEYDKDFDIITPKNLYEKLGL